MKRILIISLCLLSCLAGCGEPRMPREAPKPNPEAKYQKHAEVESRLVEVGFPVKIDYITVTIVKDKDTGHEYLLCHSAHGVAITPLKGKEEK